MKYFIAFILLTAGTAIYMNRAYAHIFTFLNAHNPGNPTTHQEFNFPAPTSTATAKYTIVTLGDSLTAGVGAVNERDSYPYRLAQQISNQKNAEVKLINLGIPGAVAADVITAELPQVAAYKPDFVTLLIGTNDMHNNVTDTEFAANMNQLASHLLKITKKVYVLNIPLLAGKDAFWPPYRMYYDWQTIHYNKLITDALVGSRVKQIDLYNITHDRALNDEGYYSPDGFHASTKTYDYWSDIIYDHLNF